MGKQATTATGVFPRMLMVLTAMTGFAMTSHATAGTITIDFETASDSTDLANGQDMDATNPFGDMFTITSSGNNAGAALYYTNADTTNTRDRDLHVGFGNVLILQNNHRDDRFAGTDIFTTPDDDASGGNITFDFAPIGQGISMMSLDVIDVDNNGQMTITMWDSADNTRVVTVPDHFSGDIRAGDVGWATVDLASGSPQESPNISGLFTSIMTEAGFDINDVVMMQVHLFGSGAIDNLTFSIIPLPAAVWLGGAGLAIVALRRRRVAG